MKKLFWLFGRGTFGVVEAWKFLRSFPFVFRILRNYGELKEIFSVVQKVFSESRISGGMPTCENTALLLESMERLFKTGIIDIDGVEEYEVSEMFREVRYNLTCAVDKERKIRRI